MKNFSNYSQLTWEQLIKKTKSWFNEPIVVTEALERLNRLITNNQRSYKVYTALLTQEGTNAPSATILENTIGEDITWVREETGVYTGNLLGGFPQDKTFLYSKTKIYSSDDSTEYSLSDSTIDKVYLTTTVSGNLEDGVLLRTPVEIRVYK